MWCYPFCLLGIISDMYFLPGRVVFKHTIGCDEICSEELLSLTDSRADGSPAKHKAQHLGCHKPCNKLTG